MLIYPILKSFIIYAFLYLINLTTDDNYKKLLNILKKRYENNRSLADVYWKQICNKSFVTSNT